MPDLYKIFDKDFNNEINSAATDIATSYQTEFNQRWQDTPVTIQAPYVDFKGIYTLILTHYPDLLTPWYEKVNDPKDFEPILNDFAPVFADWVRVSRKAVIAQLLLTWSGIGYLELVLDENGKEKYVKTEEEFAGVVEEFLARLFTAVDNFSEE